MNKYVNKYKVQRTVPGSWQAQGENQLSLLLMPMRNPVTIQQSIKLAGEFP